MTDTKPISKRAEYKFGRAFRLPVLANNETPDKCNGCGNCCASMPGFTMPSDFGSPDRKLMEECLVKALSSGRWAIDWFEGDVKPDGPLCQVYMVRPAIAGVTRMFDGSWGGRCTFLGEKGCELSFENRPYDCRALVADPPGNCDYPWSKKINPKALCAAKWRPYQAVIVRAAKQAKLAMELMR